MVEGKVVPCSAAQERRIKKMHQRLWLESWLFLDTETKVRQERRKVKHEGFCKMRKEKSEAVLGCRKSRDDNEVKQAPNIELLECWKRARGSPIPEYIKTDEDEGCKRV